MIKVRLKLESLEEGTWMMGDNPWEVRKLSSKVDGWLSVTYMNHYTMIEWSKEGYVWSNH